MVSRALIVLLLVLNLGVASWWLLRAPPAPPAPVAAPDDIARLQLLSEVPAAARPRPAAPPAPMSAPAQALAGARCLAFGPFADTAALEAARARLQPRVLRLQPRPGRPSGARGWRVWLPPQADRAAAVALAARIDAAGFKDYYVMTQGVDANAIALGRFGNEEAARRQQQALQTAGFPAQAEPLGTPSAPQWLDALVAPGLDAQALRVAGGVAEVHEGDCARLQ